MRLFVAIELPERIRQSLTALSETLRARWEPELAAAGLTRYATQKPSWVRAENLHVTIKFLGELNEPELPALCAGLRQVGAHGAARMTADRLELLPPYGRFRVVAAGFSGELERLAQLHAAMEVECERLGYRREGRAYRPHITLARLREPVPTIFRGNLNTLAAIHLPAPEFDVREFVLMQSRLGPAGAQYLPLARFPIGAVA